MFDNNDELRVQIDKKTDKATIAYGDPTHGVSEASWPFTATIKAEYPGGALITDTPSGDDWYVENDMITLLPFDHTPAGGASPVRHRR